MLTIQPKLTTKFSQINQNNSRQASVLNKTTLSDCFIKNNLNTSFKARFDFKNIPQGRLLCPLDEVHISGKSILSRIEAKIVSLYDEAKAGKIYGKYISLFDDSRVGIVQAETTASIFTNKRVGKVISKQTVEVQPDSNRGFIREIIAGTDILIGQKGNVGKITAPRVRVINDANVKEIYAKNLTIVSENSTVNKINTTKSVRLRGNVSVMEISAGHLGISGNCKINRAIISGDKAEVHIMDSPKFNNIEFKNGNGRVILHPDSQGIYPNFDKKKIIGGKIEYSDKHADGALAQSNHNYIIEFHQNF